MTTPKQPKQKKVKDIDLKCHDTSKECGMVRMINFGDGLIEICHIPLKRPEKDKRCVVVETKNLLAFLNQTKPSK